MFFVNTVILHLREDSLLVLVHGLLIEFVDLYLRHPLLILFGISFYA
jgi:hypothetical protein